MDKMNDGPAPEHGPHQHAHTAPTTEQIRTIGQRRREAEEKLEHHLAEARGRDGNHGPLQEPGTRSGTSQVDGGEVAAIQNDDQLTAADRVDMIANQALTDTDEDKPDNTGSETK